MGNEIIIDGVNVAGCILLEKNNPNCICCGDDIREYSVPFANFCEENKDCYYKQFKRLEKENKELKEWKDKVVKLFESACRCKYLNEETDMCSYTNEKCININKCAYKYQELSDNYRSALEEIKNNFMCFRSCIIPFHTGDKDKIPHNMADVIQDYCESIMNKIKEVIE